MGEIIVLLILLVLSGFFSGSETALTSLSMARAEAYLKDRRTGAHALQRLKSNTNRMLISILIGNNLVNIAASAMATVLAAELFGHLGPGIAVGVLTMLVLIFGEITPKTFAARYAGRISLLVAPPLLVFTRLVFPLVWMLEQLTVYLQGLSKLSQDPTVTEYELISMAEHGAEEGTIERQNQEMIERIFAFNNLRARDVMIPRHRLFTLDGDCTVGKALPKIAANPFTRIPLSTGASEKITRVVTMRDVLKEIVKGHMKKPLKKVAHESPLFVPLNQPIEQLFDSLRGDERRLVMVVDEYGATQGMFTLEDMLEELVGEIHDEFDKQHRVYEIRNGGLLVEGTEELRVVEEHLGGYLSGKPTDTVNRWILNYAEHIPRAGERFNIDGLEVVVEKASKRRIQRVRIMCPPEPETTTVREPSEAKETNSDDSPA